MILKNSRMFWRNSVERNNSQKKEFIYEHLQMLGVIWPAFVRNEC